MRQKQNMKDNLREKVNKGSIINVGVDTRKK